MRLFRRKKNNKGFSLVEMVCAVAILGLTSTAIGSTMIISTQNHQRGVSEVEVQQEGQLATTLINNLLVDASSASYDDATKVLTIYCEGITYTVKYNAGTQTIDYTETLMDGSFSNGVLAEGVTDFRVDLSRFTDNKNAKVDLSFERNGKSFDASSNTTARNGEAYNVGAEESAVIVCETDLVLEPNQTYHLDVSLYGNPSSEDVVYNGLVGSFGSSELRNTANDGVDIYVAPDATGAFSFVIETAAKDDATNVPLDSKTVTVRVRRVNNLSYTTAIGGVGQNYKSGTIYRIYGDVNAIYDEKQIGKAYDNDYVSPYFVDFNVVSTGSVTYTVSDIQDQGTRPYIDITLTSDMLPGSKITVNMESMHSNGSKNKTNTAYTPNATAQYVIENAQGAIWSDTGIRRGNDNFVSFHFIDDVDRDWVKGICGYTDSNQVNNTSRYLYRFRKKGTTDNSQWFRMLQDNTTNQKFNADETWAWKAGYAYEIDVIFVVIEGMGGDNPVLKFPQDDALYNELKASYSNLSKGWGGTSSTPMASYGGTLEVGAALFKYPTDYNNTTFTENKTATINVGGNAEYNFDGVNLCASHYPSDCYSADVYVYIPLEARWEKVNNYADLYFKVEFSNQSIKFNNVKQAASGKQFKIVPKMTDRYKDITQSALKNAPTFSGINTGSEVYMLGEEATGKGCVFLTVN